MPISNVSKEACAEIMISQCNHQYKQSIYGNVQKKIYGFTEEKLIHLCGEIIESCRQHTEVEASRLNNNKSNQS